VSDFIAYLLSLVSGTAPQSLTKSMVSEIHLVGGVAISSWDLGALALTVAVCVTLAAYLRFTRQGQFMSAVADHAPLAELYGISANRAILTAMVIAAALVSVGVYLYGTRASMIPNAPLVLMLLAVIATILG